MTKGKIGLLLAAAAAYGIYKYSTMSPERKQQLMDKGKKFVDENLGGLGDLFGKKSPANGASMGANM